MKTRFFLFFVTVCIASQLFSQSAKSPAGSLFIIGGGDRTPEIMHQLMKTADLSANDYIAVLPMSGEEPDSSYLYFKWDAEIYCKNTIANLNFTKSTVGDKKMLDSLIGAKLIFITGGDQNRFMDIVLHTPVFDAIHTAYEQGSTISGTSAGAAMMCKYMITGNQLLDTAYAATFYSVVDGNIELKEGLGLVENIIVDQHFVVRSRYNRLLCAMSAHPDLLCAGIDEATALVIHGNTAHVEGESQVVTFRNKGDIHFGRNHSIGFTDVRMHIYVPGESFKIR